MRGKYCFITIKKSIPNVCNDLIKIVFTRMSFIVKIWKKTLNAQ